MINLNEIVKSRKKTHVLLSYEALFRFLKEPYRGNKVINDNYQRFLAGFIGEKNVDYKLSIYPQSDFLIFQDLRLNNHLHFFQIDTLVLSRKFILILEIKNMKDELIYDSQQKQFIQVSEGKRIAYKDPILQAKTQKRHLEFWLRKHNIQVPIETIVVSSNPSTIITNIHQDPDIYNKLIHSESLQIYLDEFIKKYPNPCINRSTLKSLSNLFLTNHKPQVSNLIQKFQINKNHLIQGVPCPNCNSYPMGRTYKKWYCSSCNYSDHQAHQRVILDYFLLFKNTISNRECRELLQIKSPNTSYFALKSMNLMQTGNNSGRKYLSPSINNFPQDSSFPSKNKFSLDYLPTM